MDLGGRIRELRKEQKLSLEELAQRCGLALATLSRLENGHGVGNFRTHQKIAQALGVDVTQLYKGVEQGVAHTAVVRSESPETESFTYNEKASAVLLANQVSGRRFLPQLLRFEPGGRTAPEQYRPGTERWLFGLEGEVEVMVGKKSYRVTPGGTLYFKASLPHRFSNTRKSAARCIMVTSPVIL